MRKLIGMNVKNTVAKQKMRNFFRTQLELLKPYDSSHLQSQLYLQLKLFFTLKTGMWGAFRPLKKEPQIYPLDSEIPQIAWLYPRIENEDLVFVKSRGWVQGPFGIWEPQSGEVIPRNQIQGLLVPGLGFDSAGGRLGRGRGYYDRFLKSFSGQKVGVSYGCQMQKELLPRDSWDVSMNFIITNDLIWKVGA